MPRQLIIDTDPGIDDAVALLLALAAPELAVRGLVAVAGNAALATTARNACALVELAGREDVPVYAGCPRPIGAGKPDGAYAHGTGGLGDLVLPEPSRKPEPEHGVFFLIETLRRAGPKSVTICALGPLTNVAAALVLAPEIAAGIDELVVMGGGTRGNRTPAAEFNMHCDPLAAAIVFASGVPITLVPLDITLTVRSTEARVAPLAGLGSRCGDAAAALLGPRRALRRPPLPMHDPCVIAWLLRPGLFQAAPVAVAVETQSPLTAGMTVINQHGRGGRAPNARVLTAADADGIYRLLAERIASLP